MDLTIPAEKWIWHSEQYAARRVLLHASRAERWSPCDPEGKWFDENLIAEAEDRLRRRLWLAQRYRFRDAPAPRDEAADSLGEPLYTEIDMDEHSPQHGQPTGRKLPLASILTAIAAADEHKQQILRAMRYGPRGPARAVDHAALARVHAEFGVRAEEEVPAE